MLSKRVVETYGSNDIDKCKFAQFDMVCTILYEMNPEAFKSICERHGIGYSERNVNKK